MENTTYGDTTLQADVKVDETKNNESAGSWEMVMVGGSPGILLGAAGVMIAESFSVVSPKEDSSAQEQDGGETGAEVARIDERIPVASTVTSDMSFKEAFETARAEVGAGGAFCWHGNVYSTYRADDPEWAEMTTEQRNEHCHEIIVQVRVQPYAAPASTAPVVATADEDEGDVDVHIVGVGSIEGGDGSIIEAGYGTVDGHQAVFADTDGDGLVDTVLIDTNDNGQLDPGEVISAEGANITIEDLAMEAAMNGGTMMSEQLYEGMPDYTNDADVSSLC